MSYNFEKKIFCRPWLNKKNHIYLKYNDHLRNEIKFWGLRCLKRLNDTLNCVICILLKQKCMRWTRFTFKHIFVMIMILDLSLFEFCCLTKLLKMRWIESNCFSRSLEQRNIKISKCVLIERVRDHPWAASNKSIILHPPYVHRSSYAPVCAHRSPFTTARDHPIPFTHSELCIRSPFT